MTTPPNDRESDLERRVSVLERKVRMLAMALEHKGIRMETATPTEPSTPPPPKTPLEARPAAAGPDRAIDAPPPWEDRARPAFSGLAGLGTPKPETAPRPSRPAEYWIARVGIGLLLFGVAFLFKYAVDQGWLTPWFRVASGLTLGVALAGIGLRVPRAQRWFAPVVLGGSVATLYATGYAAFEVFALVPFATALAYVSAVTVFGFAVAMHTREVTLSLLATIGGFATPFVITGDAGTVLGGVTYESAIVLGASAVVVMTGWTPLLWIAAAGAWLSLATIVGLAPGVPAALVGVALTWTATWLVPLVAYAAQPDRPRPDFGPLIIPVALVAYVLTLMALDSTQATAGTVAAAAAVLYAGVGVVLFPRFDRRLASLHLVAGAVFAAIAVQLLAGAPTRILTWAVEAALVLAVGIRFDDRRMVLTAELLWIVVGFTFIDRILSITPPTGVPHWGALIDLTVLALAGVSAYRSRGPTRDVFAIATVYGLGALAARELAPADANGATTAAVWALLGVLFHELAAVMGSRVRIAAHLAFLIIGVVFLQAAVTSIGSPAVIDPAGLALLLTLAATIVVATRNTGPGTRTAYLGAAHVGILTWLWCELVALPVGHAWVSVAWGAYTIALLVVALRRHIVPVRTAAFVTLGMLVVKLFFVDLREVDPFWRIVLFLGFGTAFLALAYWFRTLWGAPPPPTPAGTDARAAPP